MDWKPIPTEAPAKSRKKGTHISAKFKKHTISKKSIPSISYRLFQSVSLRLLDYVKKEKKYSLQEVSDLIMDMQRTIVNLQKKRIVLFEKEKQKQHRKRPKRMFRVKKIR
ncbi:hypothetical protein J7J83_03865 [bacterium]|nr:hypothetical protein [bacterium]